MKQFFFLFTFSFLINYSSFAQKQGRERIDSLSLKLREAKNDSNKVKLLIDLCFTNYSINPDEGIKYGKEALELAESIKWKKGIANANSKIGINYWAKSDYPDALKYYFIALKINEELGDKAEMAKNYNNIGLVYRNQSDSANALENFNKSLKIYDELKNKVGIAGILGNIGLVYSDKSDFDKALDYHFKALKMNEELNDKRSLALNLGNIGTAFSKKNDYSKALEYDFEALKIQEEFGNKNGIETNFGNIGNAYLKISSDSNKQALNKFFAGDKIKALQESKKYLDSAITIQKDIGALMDLKNSYKDYSEVQASLGDYKGALESYKNFTNNKDSVFNNEKAKSITQMQLKFDQEKNRCNCRYRIKKTTAAKICIHSWVDYSSLFFIFPFQTKEKNYERKRKERFFIAQYSSHRYCRRIKRNRSFKSKKL